MKRLTGVVGVLALLAIMALPFLSTASNPYTSYYSNGSYDGFSWYSLESEDSAASMEVAEDYATFETCNSTWWVAQTFTPRETFRVTAIEIYGYGATGNTDNTMRIAISGTAAGEPDGLGDLSWYTVPVEDVMLSADNAAWMQFTFENQTQLNEGTTYAVYIRQGVGSGDHFYWGEVNTGAYPRGTQVTTVDSGANWNIQTADCAFRVYGVPTTYTAVHDATSGSVATSRIYGDFGQTYDAASAGYTVSRAGLFFDTSALLISDNVQSATLQVWVSLDASTTNFEMTVIDGSGVNGPMETTDYYELGLHTDNCGSEWTNWIVGGGYTTITLNNAGLNLINKESYTRLGLRSSRDIAGTAPTGDEYVTIFMGESDHPPILTLTYVSGALGIPDEMEITDVSVYTGYKEVGDELFVWRNTLQYDEEPEASAETYFRVQLRGDSDNVLAETVIWEWGYMPLSIYLSHAQTHTAGIAWTDNFSLVMCGSALYDEPAGYDNFTYFRADYDYAGASNPRLDTWVKKTTEWLEDSNGVDRGTYSATTGKGKWCVNPLEKAQHLFLTGIPFIDICRPELFMSSGGETAGEVDPDGAWANDLYDNTWGAYWTGAFGDLAGAWGFGGQVVVGIGMGVVIIVVGAVVRSKTNEPTIAIVFMVIVAAICLALGSFPMDVALVLTGGVLILLLHNFILQRT